MNENKVQECTSPYLEAPKPSFHLKERKKKGWVEEVNLTLALGCVFKKC
jgi:hypothetical protein